MNGIAYLDPRAPTEERVEDLLGRMTREEKVGQLMQLDGRFGIRDAVERMLVGSLIHLNGAEADAAIDAALKTRSSIPLLMADDGIHGHSFWAGATIFPTQLALALQLGRSPARRVARVAAREMRATGIKWTFSPVLCLARDLPLGQGRRDLRRGPILDRRVRLGDDPRIPGRGPGRSRCRACHRQALRRLLGDSRGPRRLRGRTLAPQAPLLFLPALRAGRPRGLHGLHDGIPVHRRPALDAQPLAAHRGAQGGVGLRRRARHRLRQRGPPREGPARLRRLRPGRRPGRQIGQRFHHGHAPVLRGLPRGPQEWPLDRGRARRDGAAGARAQVPHGTVRESGAAIPSGSPR